MLPPGIVIPVDPNGAPPLAFLVLGHVPELSHAVLSAINNGPVEQRDVLLEAVKQLPHQGRRR